MVRGPLGSEKRNAGPFPHSARSSQRLPKAVAARAFYRASGSPLAPGQAPVVRLLHQQRVGGLRKVRGETINTLVNTLREVLGGAWLADRCHHALGYVLEEGALVGDEHTALDVGDRYPYGYALYLFTPRIVKLPEE